MPRPSPGSTTGPLRAVWSVGIVAAAVVAHVGGGGSVPAALVLGTALLAVWSLATVAAWLPARCRTMRVRLAGAVALQPALHGFFEIGGHAGTSVAMPAAHLLAAAAALWWTARGAGRLVAVARALGLRLRPVRVVPTLPVRRRSRAPFDSRGPASVWFTGVASWRGPPVAGRLAS